MKITCYEQSTMQSIINEQLAQGWEVAKIVMKFAKNGRQEFRIHFRRAPKVEIIDWRKSVRKDLLEEMDRKRRPQA